MIYFSSDSHYFHSNILRYCNRPFASVEEMNERLIFNWNSLVQPEDEVYFLGDFSLAARPVELYSARLNGKKKLISGNHDFCHSYNKKSRKIEGLEKWTDFYARHGWEVLPERTTLDIEGVGVVNLCHMPYPGIESEEREDKYFWWRPVDDGKWLLHGHTHASNQMHLDKRMINVGVDAWDYKPVSIETIKQIILGAS